MFDRNGPGDPQLGREQTLVEGRQTTESAEATGLADVVEERLDLASGGVVDREERHPDFRRKYAGMKPHADAEIRGGHRFEYLPRSAGFPIHSEPRIADLLHQLAGEQTIVIAHREVVHGPQFDPVSGIPCQYPREH